MNCHNSYRERKFATYSYTVSFNRFTRFESLLELSLPWNNNCAWIVRMERALSIVSEAIWKRTARGECAGDERRKET